MDTIRTVYVESQFADKLRDGSYVMNIPGTLSVPDGSRAYVDNICFTNIFSSSIDETNDPHRATTPKTWNQETTFPSFAFICNSSTPSISY